MAFLLKTNYSLDRLEYTAQHLQIKIRIPVESPQILCEIIDRHRNVQPLGVVIVLVHVQHNDGVGQPKGGICVGERFTVAGLRKRKTQIN
jgi:hypothetical protein